MALIRLRVCASWSEPLLVAHTTLLEISCRGSIIVWGAYCCGSATLISTLFFICTRAKDILQLEMENMNHSENMPI